jgi:hypothetical protein
MKRRFFALNLIIYSFFVDKKRYKVRGKYKEWSRLEMNLNPMSVH